MNQDLLKTFTFKRLVTDFIPRKFKSDVLMAFPKIIMLLLELLFILANFVWFPIKVVTELIATIYLTLKRKTGETDAKKQ